MPFEQWGGKYEYFLNSGKGKQPAEPTKRKRDSLGACSSSRKSFCTKIKEAEREKKSLTSFAEKYIYSSNPSHH